MLILGSFPSAASLAAQQYYAHPQNLFWRILGAVIDAPLPGLDYPARCAAVRSAGIAIWDIYASCRRDGSLDSAIRDAVPNNLAVLKKSTPGIRRICFNGRVAARLVREAESAGYETVVLPSTSPANAGMGFEEKLMQWRAGLLGCVESAG